MTTSAIANDTSTAYTENYKDAFGSSANSTVKARPVEVSSFESLVLTIVNDHATQTVTYKVYHANAGGNALHTANEEDITAGDNFSKRKGTTPAIRWLELVSEATLGAQDQVKVPLLDDHYSYVRVLIKAAASETFAAGEIEVYLGGKQH
jgi:hypothetical protein